MPKDRSGRLYSSNRSKTYPYPCSSGHVVRSFSKKSRDSVEDVKEWDEARCPVCMEHPHNAVLLLCSSHEKGCRPFMCDTSSRHSNCFDQYRKTFAEIPISSLRDGTFQSSTVTVGAPHVPSRRNGAAEFAPGQSLLSDNKTKLNVACPLCRGRVNGWKVVKAARRFMNSKKRSCACETCEFNGTYTDLRKHARAVHPQARPSEADPVRQRDWRRMEQENDLRDVVSTIGSVFPEGNEILGSESIRLSLIFHLSRVRTARGQPSITRSTISFRRQSSSPPAYHIDTDTDSDALLGNDWMDFAQSPQYGPVYTPVSPEYSPRTPWYDPGNPGHSPRSLDLSLGSPDLSLGSPGYSPRSPTHCPISPEYSPSSPGYIPSSPAYIPSSPRYCPISPVYHSRSPGNRPSSPGHIPRSPAYRPMNQEYSPINPEYTARQPTPGYTMRSTTPDHTSRHSRRSQSPGYTSSHSRRSHQLRNQRERRYSRQQ